MGSEIGEGNDLYNDPEQQENSNYRHAAAATDLAVHLIVGDRESRDIPSMRRTRNGAEHLFRRNSRRLSSSPTQMNTPCLGGEIAPSFRVA